MAHLEQSLGRENDLQDHQYENFNRESIDKQDDYSRYRLENDDHSVDINVSSVLYQNNTSQVDFPQNESFKVLNKTRHTLDLVSKDNAKAAPQMTTFKTEKDVVEEQVDSNFKIRQLKSIYFNKKVAKVAILLIYSTFIISYNVGAYFLSKDLILITLNSFQEFKLASERVMCVSNSLYYVIESYSRNETIKTNFSTVDVLDYVHTQCSETESSYQDLVN